jgi:DNA-binding NarL/FixJ family response regulator
VRDVGSLDEQTVQQAQIMFVDIQGVGKKLGFRDEGLGLARALKEKYSKKKVVIYSAQVNGERFHEALRKADDFLPKNADPYEFQQLTERLANEIQNNP